MSESYCPFCGEPAVRTSVAGTRFRCGTEGPDINGEYSTGHTCDITTFCRRIAELEQQLAEAVGMHEQMVKAFEMLLSVAISPRDVSGVKMYHDAVNIYRVGGKIEEESDE